jgi:hypothetical protein
LRAADLCKGSARAVAEEWSDRLREAPERVTASELYAGRSFREATAAAKIVGAELLIVSAGLGLIRSDQKVPAYALSAVPGSTDSVLSCLPSVLKGADWWSAISKASPFANDLKQIARRRTGVVLLSLSQPYLALLLEDLRSFDEDQLKRLRVITRAPLDSIDPFLRPQFMPYDDRLDGADSPIRGTRGDFASRATHHFAREILSKNPTGSAGDHGAQVRRLIADWRFPTQIERVRHDDETLLTIIRDHWDRGQGHSSKLLRILRDDLNIACEQGRFALLMNQLRAERRVLA